MIVTEDMQHPDGGKRPIEEADVIDVDGVGVQVQVARAGLLKLIVGSNEYPSKKAFIDPADARHLAAKLNQLADEAER